MVAPSVGLDEKRHMARRRTSDPLMNKAFGLLFQKHLQPRMEADPLYLERMSLATGITGSALDTYRYGSREPGFFTIAKVALFMGVPVDALIPEQLKKPRKQPH